VVRPISAAKALQETLQLCTDKCGKSACKVLARSLFLPLLGTEVNVKVKVFQVLAWLPGPDSNQRPTG
jgi:hypothetical protein